MSMTEPQQRAAVVAEVLAMDTPAPEPAPVVAETAPEADAESDSGEPAADVIEGEDIPASQEQDADGAEEPTEGEDGEDQAAEAVEAPQFWAKEAKEHFATLDHDTQRFLVEQDKAAQKSINAKFEEAATARKNAEAKAEALTAISSKIEEAATIAADTFKGRWDGMNDQLWLQLSRESPQEYIQLRAQYDAEQSALQQANAAKEAAARVERQNWLATQAEELKTFAPDLIDPVKGKARFEETLSYLRERGAKEQDLSDVSAAVVALAYDSMQLAKLRKSTPKPTPKPVPRSGLAPAASAAAVPPQQRELQALQNRFNQTSDRGDAVKLLMAKGIL